MMRDNFLFKSVNSNKQGSQLDDSSTASQKIDINEP